MRRRLALLLPSLSIVGWLVLGAGPVAASRFGPPWMSRVIAENTQIYQQPDLSSAIVGPVAHGTILVVLGERRDDTNQEWTQNTLGYVSSDAVTGAVGGGG